MKRPQQSWIAECSWSGRARFTVGTFFTSPNSIEEARRKAEELSRAALKDILPIGVPLPDTIRLVPGVIVIQYDSELQEVA